MKYFPRFLVLPLLCCVLCLLPVPGQAQEDTEHRRILAGFYPYRNGIPQVDGITPGMRLESANAQLATSVLPSEILTYLAAGDFAVSVQPTTDMSLRQAYIDATLTHYPGVGVGEEELQHYIAGRPFPLLDPHDPQAGLKAAWNLHYRDQGETAQMWASNSLRNSSGAVERTQRFSFISMYGMHRPDASQNVPDWERRGVYSKQYSLTLAPSDMEGNQLIGVIYDKNSLPNDQWAYDPKSRRTRKLVYNPYIAPGRGVTLIEDRSGFLGYIHHYEWQYLGEQVVLVPGPIKAAEPTWGGKGNWYLVDPWELRRAIVVEARPKAAHPLYSRRVVYIDVQTGVSLYALAYDHEGNHKRTFLMVYRHPDFNPWNNDEWFAQVAAQASIDYQLERANNFQVHKVLHNRPMVASRFDVMTLLLKGK